MSKQTYFYATEDDRLMIADILKSVFGQLLDIPNEKADFTLFNEKADKRRFWLAEESRRKDIVYKKHERYNGAIHEFLDIWGSPVLEYTFSSKGPDGSFLEGRFYCCSDDADFSKKVSKFLSKFKKNFLYVKKYKTYLSPNIDLLTAKFGPDTIITKEDLS
ncbi:MAG: hypothetical protein FWC60_07835 [Firmicutes bacterium]|nr:hypothetical protein [Bacillota bacterium]